MTPSERERAEQLAETLRKETLNRHRVHFAVWPGTEYIADKLMEFAEAARREERKRCAEMLDNVARACENSAVKLQWQNAAGAIRALERTQ